MQLPWTRVGLVLIGAAAVTVLLAGASSAAGGGGKNCTVAPLDNPAIFIYDDDLDGLDDGFFIEAQYPFGPEEEVWLNVTLNAPNASVIETFNVTTLTNDSYYSHLSYSFRLLNTTDPNGTYTANVTYDYAAGACTVYDYPFFLSPPGAYQPLVSSPDTTQSGEENTTLVFALTVRNGGNNQDTILFSASDDLDWPILIGRTNASLEPGEEVSFGLTVTIPHNTPGPTPDQVLFRAVSSRNASHFDFFALYASVVAQTFAFSFAVDNTSLNGTVGTQLAFNFTLTNLGNNRDYFPVTLPAAASGWQATMPAGATLDSGQTAVLPLSVRLPYSYLSAYRWDPVIEVVAGDGLTNDSIALHARLLLPDLIVGPAGIVFNDTTFLVGAPVTIEVHVLNVGGPIAVNFYVTLLAGGSNVSSLIDIHEDGAAVASFAWTVAPGTTAIQAVVDSTSAVPEDDEANNRAFLNVTGIGTLNVAPTAVVSAAAASAHVDEATTISAAGSADADGSVVAYSFDFGDGNFSGWISQASVSHAYSAPGNYTVSLRVRDDRGAESAPATTVFSVTPASDSNGGGGGNGGGGPTASGDGLMLFLLVAILAAGAVTVLFMLRRRAPKTPPGAPPS